MHPAYMYWQISCPKAPNLEPTNISPTCQLATDLWVQNDPKSVQLLLSGHSHKSLSMHPNGAWFCLPQLSVIPGFHFFKASTVLHVAVLYCTAQQNCAFGLLSNNTLMDLGYYTVHGLVLLLSWTQIVFSADLRVGPRLDLLGLILIYSPILVNFRAF